MCDLAAVTAAVHAVGALVAVDNTTATVLGKRSLSLRTDFPVSSDTKATTGHADLLLGHVSVRDTDLLAGLTAWRTQVGAIPGPMETWLAHRSLAILDVRLQRKCGTALRIATTLRDHPGRADPPLPRPTATPGLPFDSAHEQAARQMTLFGPVVSFTLADQATAERWLDAVRLVLPATSPAGSNNRVHTTAEQQARCGGDVVHPGFVRLSVGMEDPGDLQEDLLQALRCVLVAYVSRTGGSPTVERRSPQAGSEEIRNVGAPEPFRPAATQPITYGGCAFDVVRRPSERYRLSVAGRCDGDV